MPYEYSLERERLRRLLAAQFPGADPSDLLQGAANGASVGQLVNFGSPEELQQSGVALPPQDMGPQVAPPMAPQQPQSRLVQALQAQSQPDYTARNRQRVAQVGAAARQDELRAAQAAQAVAQARSSMPTSWGMNRETPQQDINMQRAAAALNPVLRGARVVRTGDEGPADMRERSRMLMASPKYAAMMAPARRLAGVREALGTGGLTPTTVGASREQAREMYDIQQESKGKREANSIARMQKNAQSMMGSANPRVQARGYALADALAAKGQAMGSFTQPGQGNVDLMPILAQARKVAMQYGNDAAKAYFQSSVATAMDDAKRKAEQAGVDKEIAFRERQGDLNRQNELEGRRITAGSNNASTAAEWRNTLPGRTAFWVRAIAGDQPPTNDQIKQAEDRARKELESEGLLKPSAAAPSGPMLIPSPSGGFSLAPTPKPAPPVESDEEYARRMMGRQFLQSQPTIR